MYLTLLIFFGVIKRIKGLVHLFTTQSHYNINANCMVLNPIAGLTQPQTEMVLISKTVVSLWTC